MQNFLATVSGEYSMCMCLDVYKETYAKLLTLSVPSCSAESTELVIRTPLAKHNCSYLVYVRHSKPQPMSKT